MNNFNRRQFLSLGARAICGAGLALGARPFNALAQQAGGDYRALVCIYLEGGMDGFSLIVPDANAEYNEYANSRRELAIPRASITPFASADNSFKFGFHPAASALSPLYQRGDMATLMNVGTLIRPTTKEMFNNNSVELPEHLFGHSSQTKQWLQLQGAQEDTKGWGALASSILSSVQTKDYLTSISLSGSNYWQSGYGPRPFNIGANGLVQYLGLDEGNSYLKPRRDAFFAQARKTYPHLFTQAYADLQNTANDITAELGLAISKLAPLPGSVPANNELAQRLSMVAQIIAARDTLGMSRQIFYVRMGGFDVHDFQNRDTPILFGQLADAIAYFQNTMDSLGTSNNVTTFTASDFGRTLTGNGDGTDHGWGNHHLIVGGAVNGGDVYGTPPRLDINGPDAIRNGRTIPTTAASQYAATLLNWIGLNNTQIDAVLPDVSNFSSRDLGILS